MKTVNSSNSGEEAASGSYEDRYFRRMSAIIKPLQNNSAINDG